MNFDPKNKTILVVDDEEEILNLIADFLHDDEGYKVFTARDAKEALESILPFNKIDLVLSDINMPQMRGFEFLNKVREHYPHIKRILITAYNVEDYFELAMKHDVGNIFVKTTPFNFHELSTILKNLLTDDIFGAERYFHSDCQQHSLILSRGDAIEHTAHSIIEKLAPVKDNNKLELVLVELLTNAIFYGIRSEPPDKKEIWNHDFELKPDEAIQIKIFRDSMKYAISITDLGGRLKKYDVLYWLHRQLARDENGLPLGIMDTHGRGFFIARKYIDRLIINIQAHKKTEIVILNYFNELYSGYKPLYINEL